MTIHADATQILARAVRLARMAHSIDQQLLIDQREAVSPGVSQGGRGSDISDPTYRAMRALAPFAKWSSMANSGLRRVDNELNRLERDFQIILSESGRALKGEQIKAEPRCPGHSVERRTRLGGCGNQLATYKDRQGNDHIRPDYLCVTCMREKRADEQAEGAA